MRRYLQHLIATGLELSPSGHLRFTELCQCTRSQQRDCGTEIASIDLEVQTYPPKSSAPRRTLARVSPHFETVEILHADQPASTSP